MIRVGFLIMNFSNGGGTERVTSIIANGLSEKGYSCYIISCQDGLSPKFNTDANIKLLSLSHNKSENPILRKIHNVKKLKKIIIENKLDIMIAVDVALFLYLIPSSLQGRCKCIAWEHFNYYTVQNAFSKISRFLSVKIADKLIVLGKEDKNNYLRHYPKAKNIDYIYNPLTMEVSSSSKLNRKRIIAVGRLEKQKGFDYLISSWSLLEKKYPDWKLDIFGNGSLEIELKKQIKKLDLINIHIKPFSKNIREEFLDSSLFVLSSRYEGFGLVLLEAQSCGLPCISFNCKEGPSEIIDDNVNGFLVECYNIFELAEKIELLINNRNKLEKFALNSKKDLNRFDVKTIILKWDELIKNIVEGEI